MSNFMKNFDKRKLKWVRLQDDSDNVVGLILYYGKRQIVGQIFRISEKTYRAVSLSTALVFVFPEKKCRSMVKAMDWLVNYTVKLYEESESKPEFA
jgi:hypothetical protein